MESLPDSLDYAELCDQPGESRSTLDACRKAVERNPSDTLSILGLALQINGLFGRDSMSVFVKWLDRVVQLAPDEAPVRISRGYGYLMERKMLDAAREAEIALRLEPGNKAALDLLMVARRGIDRNGRLLPEGKTIDSVHVVAFEHIQRGRNLLRSENQPEAALQEFRTAAAILPKDAEVYVDIGRALAKLNRTEEAIAAFDTALTRDSTLLPAYMEMAGLYTRLRNEDEVAKTMQRAAKALPDNEGLQKAVAAMAAIKANGGKVPGGQGFSVTVVENKVTEVTEPAPNNPETIVRAAEERLKLGQNENAATLIRYVARMRPDSAGAWGIVAAVSARAGYKKEAVAAWKRAIELEPKYFDGKPDERRAYQDAISLVVGNVPPATIKSLDDPLSSR